MLYDEAHPAEEDADDGANGRGGAGGMSEGDEVTGLLSSGDSSVVTAGSACPPPPDAATFETLRPLENSLIEKRRHSSTGQTARTMAAVPSTRQTGRTMERKRTLEDV